MNVLYFRPRQIFPNFCTADKHINQFWWLYGTKKEPWTVPGQRWWNSEGLRWIQGLFFHLFYHVYVVVSIQIVVPDISIFVSLYSSHIQGVKALRLGNIYRDRDQQDLAKSGPLWASNGLVLPLGIPNTSGLDCQSQDITCVWERQALFGQSLSSGIWWMLQT